MSLKNLIEEFNTKPSFLSENDFIKAFKDKNTLVYINQANELKIQSNYDGFKYPQVSYLSYCETCNEVFAVDWHNKHKNHIIIN